MSEQGMRQSAGRYRAITMPLKTNPSHFFSVSPDLECQYFVSLKNSDFGL
jgi:hypothetical protein